MNFSAINDWVFIRRDEQDKTFLGLEISEKALTKKKTGVITHSVDNQLRNCGVHIPHYRVEDYDIGGESYAVVRGGDLFALKNDSTYRPINGYVKVRKCVNDHYRDEDDEIFLYRTDEAVEETTWVEIVDVADDCEHITKEDIGGFCISPESHDKLQRLEYSKDYMLHESLIEFVTGE
jgi:co-chaperonin GroES (HSP10)